MAGSKAPILGPANASPGQAPAFREEWQNDKLPCLDGRELSAIEILVEVSGDYKIASERTGMAEGAFAMALARCNPTSLAVGLKAINLLQVARLAMRVATEIEDRLDEAKPGQLIGLYPRLVELIPALTESKISVHAQQTNNYNIGTTGPDTQMPPEIKAAYRALGIPIPGEDGPLILDQQAG